MGWSRHCRAEYLGSLFNSQRSAGYYNFGRQYAKHVSGADAGIVIQEPLHQRTFLAALETARDRDSSEHRSKSGTEYGKQKSLYEGKSKATELIIAKGLEATGSKKPSI